MSMLISVFASCVCTHVSISKYIKHIHVHRYVPNLCPLRWSDTPNEQGGGRGAEVRSSYIQADW